MKANFRVLTTKWKLKSSSYSFILRVRTKVSSSLGRKYLSEICIVIMPGRLPRNLQTQKLAIVDSWIVFSIWDPRLKYRSWLSKAFWPCFYWILTANVALQPASKLKKSLMNDGDLQSCFRTTGTVWSLDLGNNIRVAVVFISHGRSTSLGGSEITVGEFSQMLFWNYDSFYQSRFRVGLWLHCQIQTTFCLY